VLIPLPDRAANSVAATKPEPPTAPPPDRATTRQSHQQHQLPTAPPPLYSQQQHRRTKELTK
jgi:hypothetical protein